MRRTSLIQTVLEEKKLFTEWGGKKVPRVNSPVRCGRARESLAADELHLTTNKKKQTEPFFMDKKMLSKFKLNPTDFWEKSAQTGSVRVQRRLLLFGTGEEALRTGEVRLEPPEWREEGRLLGPEVPPSCLQNKVHQRSHSDGFKCKYINK